MADPPLLLPPALNLLLLEVVQFLRLWFWVLLSGLLLRGAGLAGLVGEGLQNYIVYFWLLFEGVCLETHQSQVLLVVFGFVFKFVSLRLCLFQELLLLSKLLFELILTLMFLLLCFNNLISATKETNSFRCRLKLAMLAHHSDVVSVFRRGLRGRLSLSARIKDLLDLLTKFAAFSGRPWLPTFTRLAVDNLVP
jgi:hypothetical protein